MKKGGVWRYVFFCGFLIFALPASVTAQGEAPSLPRVSFEELLMRARERVPGGDLGEDKKVGEDVAKEFFAGGGFVETADATLSQYLKRVFLRVLAHADLRYFKPEDFTLYVGSFRQRSSGLLIQAESLPGGHIFFDERSIAAVAVEAELAHLFAHEVVHIDMRHWMRERYFVASPEVAPLLAYQEQVQQCAPQDTQCMLVFAMLRAYNERLEDFNEREAHLRALEIVARAGYDPAALLPLITEHLPITYHYNMLEWMAARGKSEGGEKAFLVATPEEFLELQKSYTERPVQQPSRPQNPFRRQ